MTSTETSSRGNPNFHAIPCNNDGSSTMDKVGGAKPLCKNRVLIAGPRELAMPPLSEQYAPLNKLQFQTY